MITSRSRKLTDWKYLKVRSTEGLFINYVCGSGKGFNDIRLINIYMTRHFIYFVRLRLSCILFLPGSIKSTTRKKWYFFKCVHKLKLIERICLHIWMHRRISWMIIIKWRTDRKIKIKGESRLNLIFARPSSLMLFCPSALSTNVKLFLFFANCVTVGSNSVWLLLT